MAQEIGQGCRQVRLQWRLLATHIDGLNVQRVVQLQPTAAATTQLGEAAIKAKECGDGETDAGWEEGMTRRRGIGCANADERDAQAIAAMLAGQADRTVIL